MLIIVYHNNPILIRRFIAFNSGFKVEKTETLESKLSDYIYNKESRIRVISKYLESKSSTENIIYVVDFSSYKDSRLVESIYHNIKNYSNSLLITYALSDDFCNEFDKVRVLSNDSPDSDYIINK